MKRIFYFISLSIIMMVGCQRIHNDKIIKEFKPSELAGKKMNLHEGCYSQIQLLDTIILLNDQCSTDYFHLLTKRTCEEVFSFGKKGKGPDEFLDPEILPGSFELRNNNIYFWIYNVNQKKIQYYNLYKIINGNYYPEKALVVNPKILGGFQLNFLNDSILIGKDHVFGKGLFFMYNIKRRTIKWINFMPKVKELPSKNKIPIMYNSYISVNKKRNKIVVAYNYFNRLSIFNEKGNSELNIDIGKLVIPDFRQPTKYMIPQNIKIYFEGVIASGNYIYALYQNCTQKEEVSFPNEKKINSGMLIFDWKGNLKNAFLLGTYIYAFSIDEKRNAIYGLTLNDNGYSDLLFYRIKN